MIPYIRTPFGDISSFSLCAVIGILMLFFLVHAKLKTSSNNVEEEVYIFPKIVFSGVVGFIFAGIFDSLFKFHLYGEFKITGITFYGGLIGSIVSFYVILRITEQTTTYSVSEWFSILTPPFIVFHIFGRIGCFFGGCCYGKPTDSCFGIVFPNNEANNIFHNGVKCYPTQLFEVTVLIVILLIILTQKNKFEYYLLLYSVSRFLIEFFRGDERGNISNIFSPSQIVSIVIFLTVICCKGFVRLKKASSAILNN